MEISLKDLQNGYIHVCQAIMAAGQRVVVRNMQTLEVTGVTLIFENTDSCMLPVGVNRGINTRLAAIEALCLIAGTWRPELVRVAAPKYADVLVAKDDDASVHAAYGPRLISQMRVVEDLLLKDPTTRQAILNIWSPNDLTYDGDKPCTISIQFLWRRAKLEMHVYMRSQDVWLGLGLDGFVFSQLQHTMAYKLGTYPGRYVHHVGSMHAYDRNWEGIHNLKELSKNVTPTDMPKGVRSPDHYPYPQDVAAELLNVAKGLWIGSITSELNSWYVERMRELRDSTYN